MIGGVIVLALFLTALVAMVGVTQQYDTYQNIANNMLQKDIDRVSENVTAINPGLYGPYTVTGCGGKCTQYNMTLGNVGGIAVQIVRVYINSTGSGCTVDVGLCVLNPAVTPTSYTFNMYERNLNPGEFNHTVHLWLPQTIMLPNQTYTPSNSIWIVTARGRVFTFQWPFPPVGQSGGQGANPTIQTGVMKIAYNSSSYNSINEKGGGVGGYCHPEAHETYAAGGGTTLDFVNPWITSTILTSVSPGTLWIYVNTVNSLNYTVTIDWGMMILQVASSAANAKQYFVGGPLAGVVYPITPGHGEFTAAGTPVNIKKGDQFIMIFHITQSQTPSSGGMSFSGTATVNNANPPFATRNAEDSSFRALSIYCDGLFVRSSC